MSKIVPRLWGVFYTILYFGARTAFWMIRPRLRGTMVAIWCRGQILLVQSSYRRGWSLPGGLARKRESLAEAAVREVHEEVGIQLKAEDMVHVGAASGEFGPHDTSNFFEVEVAEPVNIVIDGREIIFGEFVTPNEALRRALNRNVRTYLVGRER